MSPRRRFKKKDWNTVCGRLDRAVELLAESPTEHDLDSAVLAFWSFGEHAINACLELSGEKPVYDHSQPLRALDLKKSGILSRDYDEVLERLERFRKTALYLAYRHTEPSTHYSRADVRRCAEEVGELRREVERWLQDQGAV